MLSGPNSVLVISMILSTAQIGSGSDPVVHELNSKRQSAVTSVRMLLPDRLPGDDEPRLPVVYVLPVEAGETMRWGNSLAEVQKHDLQNRHHVVCVFPTFADLPWYADHPINPQLQQEAYLLQEILPLVEQNYPVSTDPTGRLLVGFSKSGWGAWSLLLRHPDVFYRAAAFDAPLMMNAPGRYGSGPIFGSVDNFRQYHISNLLEQRAVELRKSPARLMLIGRGNFQSEHVQIHDRLESATIPHAWIDGEEREHSWHSGWLPEAFEWLTRNTP